MRNKKNYRHEIENEEEEDVFFKNKQLEPKKISEERLLLNQAIKITGNILLIRVFSFREALL